MFASILNLDKDLLIFLKDEEIKLLGDMPIKGEIFEFQDVRNVYSLEILVREKKKREYTNGAAIFFEKNQCQVYLDSSYQKLKEEGWLGGRFGNLKFDMMAEKYAKEYDEFSSDFRAIKHKYENREKIIKYIKREELSK